MKRLISLTILLIVSVLPLHAAERKPALWAVYYAWYQTGATSSMWTVEGTDKPRSKAQPLIGYYDSDNPEIVRWHIRLAKAAGIDAFLVSWLGGANISGRAFEKVILPVAAEEKFQVALCSECRTSQARRACQCPESARHARSPGAPAAADARC